MTAPGVFTPYSTLSPFFPATKPTWIPSELDQQRIMSYQLYEQMYWNVPETFRLVARGTEDKPIYVPSGKVIVETTNRYTSPRFGFTVSGAPGTSPSQESVVGATAFIENFFTREKFLSKFAGNKRYGLIRGDWLWHLVADSSKPLGSRISIHPLDPGSYFPIWHPDDLDRILGCHIVEQFVPEGETDAVIKRTTYRKSDWDLKSPPGGPILFEQAIFKLDDWGGPDSKPTSVLRPLEELPITTLPVYHVKNFDEPQNPFGSSELRGLERIAAAVNQAISDEELALALQGLGFYGTDAPSPTDDEGNDVDWVVAPGMMAEIPAGSKIWRIDGATSVTPYQDHMNYLHRRMDEASATPDVAKGRVDVSVAESGISLYIQLSPLLAKTDEKDISIREVHSQMFYDLTTQWFPIYEGVRFEGLVVNPTAGDKIPTDRKAKLAELDAMLDRHVISAAFYRQEAAKLGYVFPSGIGLDVVEEQQALAEAKDSFVERASSELDNADQESSNGQVVTAP